MLQLWFDGSIIRGLLPTERLVDRFSSTLSSYSIIDFVSHRSYILCCPVSTHLPCRNHVTPLAHLTLTPRQNCHSNAMMSRQQRQQRRPMQYSRPFEKKTITQCKSRVDPQIRKGGGSSEQPSSYTLLILHFGAKMRQLCECGCSSLMMSRSSFASLRF